jgi:hypothetical protein
MPARPADAEGVALHQHRLATLIVAAALAATAGAFMFTLPRGPDRGGDGVALSFPAATPAEHGWVWPDRIPGFVFDQPDERWNTALLKPSDLADARADAVAAGVAPRSLRILSATRTSLRTRPEILLAGMDAAGTTCIGVQLHTGPVSFRCPPRTPGVVVAEAIPRRSSGGFSTFVTGIVRADVTRVTVTAPGSTYVDARGGTPVVRRLGPQTAYTDATPGWWGTFEASTWQPGPWRAQVRFYGARGLLGVADVHFAHPDERIVLAG